MMTGSRRFMAALSLLGGLFSLACCCYERKITKIVEYSNGAWNDDGSRFIFMQWERDFRMPKGLARFPDGGIPKYLRDECFVCVYDRAGKSIRKIGTAVGKPRGYPPAARFSWKGARAVYKIWNAHEAENSQNPIMLIDMESYAQQKIIDQGEKPELSPDASRVAYIKGNALYIFDIPGRASVKAIEPSSLELVFTMWNDERAIDLHVREAGSFAVYSLDIAQGRMSKSRKPYLKNFGNHHTPDAIRDALPIHSK